MNPKREFADSWRPEDKALESAEDEFFAAKYHENPEAKERYSRKGHVEGLVNHLVRRGRQMGF